MADEQSGAAESAAGADAGAGVSATLGRSVRLFLVEGKATGLITAEIVNWTGHVLSGSRSQLPKMLLRPELARTGLYLLYGADMDDPDMPRLYIGESDKVAARLKQHNQENSKEYWERSCVITSKDENITKAHARYLEARVIEAAHSAGRAHVDNGTSPPRPSLPESDRSDMEYFLEQIRLVLPVLGIDFLRESPKEFAVGEKAPGQREEESPLFELIQKKSGLSAFAREVDGDFVVLKGSYFVPEWRQASDSHIGYAKRHRSLKAAGKLLPTTDGLLLRLQEDTIFSSPSAASATILGRRDNGRRSWKLKGSSLTYAEWQEQQTAASAGALIRD